VACLHAAHRDRVEAFLGRGGWEGLRPALEVHAQRTPEIISLCHSAMAVSGSVGLELLARGKPAAVVYQLRSSWDVLVVRALKTCKYISLVNLLADKELYPEFLSPRCQAEAVGGHVLRWLNEPEAHAALCRELGELRGRVAAPGATERAAEYVAGALRARPAGPPRRVA
jgi:lipid-A-disaccharide synthase